MSHYFTIPTNTNGIVTDLNAAGNFKSALNPPFTVSDVFIYSHGWWTSADSALAGYNRFTIEFSTLTTPILKANPTVLTKPPIDPLGVAIHWPSMIDDDSQAVVDNFEAFSFYTMGQRANIVGANAVYALLRLVIQESPATPKIHFIGHSFGCRVVCSAIQEILKDAETIPQGQNLYIRAVLLEAAFDQNDLEKNALYGGLSQMPNLKVLATYSSLDTSLNKAYPLSQEINIFKGSGGSNNALGGVGPTDQTAKDFGGMIKLIVGPGFSFAQSAAAQSRLVAADLSPLHEANPNYGQTDHHSDIFHPEIYHLICGFLFQ